MARRPATPLDADSIRGTYYHNFNHRYYNTIMKELSELKKEIPHKWRVQSFSTYKAKASCVAYVDARDVMDLLDEVVGPEAWQDDYKMVGDERFAGIGIFYQGDWIWKWDTGSESNVEKKKGEVSDSFKRAAVKWGVGRFLYAKKVQYVASNKVHKRDEKPCTCFPINEQGQRIWDLTEYINKGAKTTQNSQNAKSTSSAPQNATEGQKSGKNDTVDPKVQVQNRLQELNIEKDGMAEFLDLNYPDEYKAKNWTEILNQMSTKKL